MQELNSLGHDIGNHSKTHTDFKLLTEAEVETELTDNKTFLDGIGCIRASAHVAYPNGSWDSNTITAMRNTGMLSGRLATGSGVITSSFDWYHLNCFTGGYGQTLEQLKTYITAWATWHRMAFIYFHDIGGEDDPSVEDFTALCEWIKAQGYRTYTISDVRALLP
jgi:peptidoglycan/xylan/chitin deacetylase (PgdA/CDA1 family)